MLYSIVRIVKFWSLCTSGSSCTSIELIPLRYCLPPQPLNTLFFLQWIFPYMLTLPLCSSKHRVFFKKKKNAKKQSFFRYITGLQHFDGQININNYNNTQKNPLGKSQKFCFSSAVFQVWHPSSGGSLLALLLKILDVPKESNNTAENGTPTSMLCHMSHYLIFYLELCNWLRQTLRQT